MDLTQLANLGEFIGGVAVLVTLIYLAMQIRQSNEIGRADSIRAFIRDYNQFLYRVADNEDIWQQGSADFESLSPGEQRKLHIILLSQYMLGLGDFSTRRERHDDFAAFVDNAVASGTRGAGFSYWWTHWRPIAARLNPDYVRRVESLSREAPELEAMPWFDPEKEA